MKVAWSEPAVADLVAIYDYIARPHAPTRALGPRHSLTAEDSPWQRTSS
jgi:hypothetical protein